MLELLIILFVLLSMYTAMSIWPNEMPKVPVEPCPPHDWYMQELRDEDGAYQGERLVCKKCGPMSHLIDGSIE